MGRNFEIKSFNFITKIAKQYSVKFKLAESLISNYFKC